ncbi:MAG: Arc family DNA-binding protein [Chloroflexi bacterium]|nr:Arc family DNA-binding protein [Chloroflexota bacterium]MBU1661885.1 Arc family DNA-binding protein [Chloroflexota bacterium]
MPTLTVKNIPDDLYVHLKRYAEMNRRSLNSEIIVCIESTIRSNRIQPEASLARARKLREKTARYPITDSDFNEAKMMGRP